MEFDWDSRKDAVNRRKHGISFSEAQQAFLDSNRIIAHDTKHGTEEEKRYFCFGKVGKRVMTVRFTVRENKIRIFGAGYWREGRRRYERENKIS